MADTEQVTSQTPSTKQKNPKRVAAGKAVAERTRRAREAQKKALAEAQIVLANDRQKRAAPVPDAPTAPPPVTDAPSAPVPGAPIESAKNVLTITQWLSVISIIVSLVGVYYKREEIKGVFTKKPRASPPSPVVPRAPPPVDAAPRGIRKMD